MHIICVSVCVWYVLREMFREKMCTAGPGQLCLCLVIKNNTQFYYCG